MCSCDQSLVTLAFLWEMLSQPQFYKDLTRKTAFFEGWSWFKFNNLELALGTNLKFYITKRVKTKSQKVLGGNSYVCTSYRGKTGRGTFLPPPPHSPSWIGLISILLINIAIVILIFHRKCLYDYQCKRNKKRYAL